MKKQMLTLALSLTLCLTLLAGCGDAALSSSESGGSSLTGNGSVSGSDTTSSGSGTAQIVVAPIDEEKNQEAREEYDTLLKGFYETKSEDDLQYSSYFFRDLDGNGVEELIYLYQSSVTVYAYDYYATKVGYHDFGTGTLRLLSSDDPSCPGIFYFTTGGGLESYGYLSVKGYNMTMEKLWDEDFSDAFTSERDKIVEYSDNKQLIEESKKVYQQNKDVVSSPLESVASDPSVKRDQKVRDAYTAFLQEWYQDEAHASVRDDCQFYFKDLDGNGVEEMIFTQEWTNVTVYTFDDKVTEIGNYEFYTGTLRLLTSDNPDCPGIFCFTVGGGLENYRYLTVKNDKMTIEKLWDEDFADSYEDRDRIVEYTDNKLLVEESGKAYRENRDVPFMPLEAVAPIEPAGTRAQERRDVYLTFLKSR